MQHKNLVQYMPVNSTTCQTKKVLRKGLPFVSPGNWVIGRKAHEEEIFSNFCLQWINQWYSQVPSISMSLSDKQASIYRCWKKISFFFFLPFPFQPNFLFPFCLSTISLLLPSPSCSSASLCMVKGGKVCLTAAISYLSASKCYVECGVFTSFIYFFKI